MTRRRRPEPVRPGPRPAGPELGLRLGLPLAMAAALLVFDPDTTAAAPKRLALLVVALLALLASLRRAPALPTALGLWAAFVAWSALSMLWGSPAGLGELAGWAAALGCAVAALALPRPALRQAVRLAGALIGGVAGALALVQAAGGARGLAIHGGQGNPNWLGMVLALALFPSLELGLALARRRARLAWLVGAALAAELGGLVVSHARVAQVAVLAAAALVAAGRRFGVARAAAGAALAGVLGLVLSLVVAGRGWSRTQPTAGDVPAPLALAGRVWIWRASGDAALRSLPFGAGLGRFPHAFLDAQGARLAELSPGEAARRFQNATSAHDDYLEVTVSSGLPALLLLGGALAAGLAAHARGRAAWPAGAATVLVFAVCALGDSPLGQPAAVGLLALVLASGRRPARRTRAVPALAWLGAAALLAPTLAAYLAMRRATLAEDTAPPERLARLASAARLDPRSGEIALSLGLAELSLGDAAAALPELERSRALLANVGTDVAIGNAQLLLGDPSAADAAYRRALAHDPGSFRAHANRIEALRQLGRLDEAARELAVARQLEPTHPGLQTLADRLGR